MTSAHRKFYKFTSWNPNTTGNCPHDKNCQRIAKCYSKENLLNSQLFLSSASQFNDPFDFSPFLDTMATSQQVLDKSIETVRMNENLQFDEAVIRAKELIDVQELNTSYGLQKAVQRLHHQLSKTGVCCFTTNDPSNIKMWGIYGSKHTGICLEFDFPSLAIEYLLPPEALLSLLTPVKYSSSLPKINIFTYKCDDLLNCVTTKSLDWKDENEFRLMAVNHVGTFKYMPNRLTAIYAGCKMQDPEFEDLKDTIRQMKHPPHLYRCIKLTDKFGFSYDQFSF